MADLYGDLEEKVKQSDRVELEKKIEVLEAENANLLRLLEIVRKEKMNLERNISTLYETAVSEISRKDKMIASLMHKKR